MPSMITPRFLDSSFNYGTNPKYASENIHRDLKTISEATFLKVNESGKIVKIGFIEWIWEQLKGVAGFIDHTKKEIVRLRVKQLLVYSAENGYISKEDFIGPESLINNLAKNMGLTPSEPNKIQDLEEFDELIHAIAAKTFHPESKEPNYQQWISKYHSRHIRDFEPHSIITRIWLDCFDTLTLDEELAESEFPFQNSNFSSQLIKNNVQKTPPPPTVAPVVVFPVPLAHTKKSASWTKRIGLTLLGAGAITGAYYAGQEYLKHHIIHPLPEPDSGYGKGSTLMGISTAIIIALGLLYCGKKKLHKYLINASRHVSSSWNESSATVSTQNGGSRSMFGGLSNIGSLYSRYSGSAATRVGSGNSLGTQNRNSHGLGSYEAPGLPVVRSEVSAFLGNEEEEEDDDVGKHQGASKKSPSQSSDDNDIDLDTVRRKAIKKRVLAVKNGNTSQDFSKNVDDKEQPFLITGAKVLDDEEGWTHINPDPDNSSGQPMGAQADNLPDFSNMNPKDLDAVKKSGSPNNLTNTKGSPITVRIRLEAENKKPGVQSNE